MVFYLHHDVLLLHPAEKALKIATTIEGRAQLDFHLVAGVQGKLFKREQWAFHARRRNFKGVFNSDWIFDIQNTADLTADQSTVIHQNAALFIDINTQQ